MDSTLVNWATGSGLGSGIGSKRLLGTFLLVNGESFPGGGEVVFVDFETGIAGHFHSLRSDAGGADAGEGVEEVVCFPDAMNADALLHKGNRKSGGMGAFLVA